MRKYSILVNSAVILFVIAGNGLAQGTFGNLNFESANISGYTAGDPFVPIGNALPDWSGYSGNASNGTNATSMVAYDATSAGGPVIAVNDANTGFGFTPLQGNFSAYLAAGSGVSTAIAQTATIPFGTKSLMVELSGDVTFDGMAYLIVSIGGQTISITPLTTFPAYTLYGADISGYAGDNTELRFTELSPVGVGPASVVIDNIMFSTTPVPEPGTLALFGAGAALLALCRRRKPSPK